MLSSAEETGDSDEQQETVDDVPADSEKTTIAPKEQAAPPPSAGPEDIQKQVRSPTGQLAELGVMLQRLDSRMNSLCEILKLAHQKSMLMNKRIDSIAEVVNGGKHP